MCLPIKTGQSDPSGSPARSMLAMCALMLLACVGGPTLAGAIGGPGAGVLVGAGGVVFALGLCAAVPAAVAALRRRSARRTATPVVEQR